MAALDANGEEFDVGDRALHISNELDSREVVAVGDGTIDIFVISKSATVPSRNYIRIPG